MMVTRDKLSPFMSIARLALKDIRFNLSFSLIFVATLCFGLTSLGLVRSLTESISSFFVEKNKEALGADISIQTRRPLSEMENQAIGKILAKTTARVSNITSVYSMASSVSGVSRLVNVVGVDDEFPLYGRWLFLEGEGSIQNGARFPLKVGSAWIYEDLANQFSIGENDSIKIGYASLPVDGIIDKDPSLVNLNMRFTPQVIVRRRSLSSSGLLTPGSIVRYQKLILLPEGNSAFEILKELKASLTALDVRVESSQTVMHRLGRASKYMGDYLSLIAIMALILSGVALAYLFHGYIASKTSNIAAFLMVGIPRWWIFILYFVELLLLIVVGVGLSLGLTGASLPLVYGVLPDFLPRGLSLSLTSNAIFTTLLVALMSTLCFCLPSILGIMRVSVRELLIRSKSMNSPAVSLQLFSLLPGLLCYWVVAVIQSQSLKVASAFLGALVSLAVLLVVVCYGFLFLLKRVRSRRNFVLQMLIWDWMRRPVPNIIMVTVLGLIVALVSYIPQLQVNLIHELVENPNKTQPELFLFDIPDERSDELQNWMRSQQKAFTNSKPEIRYMSPLIRGRLIRINEEELKDVKSDSLEKLESEMQSRMRRRMYNLSARAQLQPSEKIIEGSEFSGKFDPSLQVEPELSVEKRFAERLSLKLGDVLTFLIEGVEIRGKIRNLRKVRWTSFEPNFFVYFQPGVIDDAPKSFIASVYNVVESDLTGFERSLTRAFPNVPVINVGQLVRKVMVFFSDIARLVWLVTLISGGSCFVILYAINSYRRKSYQKEFEQMKILGLPRTKFRQFLLANICVVAFLSVSLGSSASLALSYIVQNLVFQGDLVVALAPLVVVGLLAFSMTLISGAGLLNMTKKEI